LRVGDWRVIMRDEQVRAVLHIGPRGSIYDAWEAGMGEMISIPVEEYRRLLALAEGMSDVLAYDRAVEALATGTEELVPAEVARRLVAGEAPLRVWRDHRGLTRAALSERSGVNRVQIANIESGSKTGSVVTLRKLAAALGVALDDLV
jgi:mRNA interferase RelE/StbE